MTAASFISGCGGGGVGSPGSIGGTKPQTGPNGILNGSSLASATSYWASSPCHVQIELTSDKAAYTVVVDKTGTTSAGTAIWTVNPDPTSIQIGNSGAGLGGFYWISALKNITGSIAAKSFSAGVSVTTMSTTQSLGTCSFVLTQGNLKK